jgi:hypothetical protein
MITSSNLEREDLKILAQTYEYAWLSLILSALLLSTFAICFL